LVRGWFKDTLATFVPPAPIAVLRLDGDWYESTWQCLEALYPHVAPGGLIIIDDYYAWDGCARAVHAYLAQHQLAERIRQSRAGVAYVVKGQQWARAE
jgi:O-methyltransferase